LFAYASRQGFMLPASVDGKSAPKKSRRLAVQGCIGGVGILGFRRGCLGI
jgi:hypothetical protein